MILASTPLSYQLSWMVLAFSRCPPKGLHTKSHVTALQPNAATQKTQETTKTQRQNTHQSGNHSTPDVQKPPFTHTNPESTPHTLKAIDCGTYFEAPPALPSGKMPLKTPLPQAHHPHQIFL